MKKMMVMAMMMAMSISANAMSYSVARNEALFLSDKMAYELGLNGAQYDAVYEINLDYLMSMNGQGDVFGIWWSRRNSDLCYVLSAWQYNKYMACSYFYRPLVWNAGKWQFGIYRHYSNPGLFYMSRPAAYASYKGGNNHRSDRYYADRRISKSVAKVSVADSHSMHANSRLSGRARSGRQVAGRGGVVSSGRR